MSSIAAEEIRSNSTLRFNLSMQRSRMAAYLVGGAGSVLAYEMNVYEVEGGMLIGLVFALIAELNALLFYSLYKRRFDCRWGIDLNPFWLAADISIVTIAVAITGGSTSPWFVWYLGVTACAAFAAGLRTALAVALISSFLYILVAFMVNDIVSAGAGMRSASIVVLFTWGGSFFFVRGIANLKERHLMIKGLKADLGRKVEELTDLTGALEEANISIKRADEMKTRFLADMSHELRTPLNSIIGFSEVLLSDAGEDRVKSLRFLNNVHSSGVHLLGLINDLLDLSKVEAGKMEMHPEEFEIPPLIAGVIEVSRGVAERRQVEFDVQVEDDLPTIESDPVRFKQILYNLLSNAVKYSPEGGRVIVWVAQLEAVDSPLGIDSVAISVSDHGAGIAEDEQASVFDEFHQTHETTASGVAGTGLGLALVKRFVEVQGGQVSLESDLGDGSTFTVVLPIELQTE